jgi:uncharacterized protein YhdP
MWDALKRIAKVVLVAAGVAVIVAAMALGGFRLLAAQLPSYQAELQAWIAAELGLRLEFERLDLRLGFRGPELTFYDAAIASSGPVEPFVVAEEATITLDLLAALTRREFSPRRLVFSGIRLTVVRDEQGSLYIEGAPQDTNGWPLFNFDIPREAELVVRDSHVAFVDVAMEREWRFENVTIEVDQGPESIAMTARADPPREVARRIEMSVDGGIADRTRLSDDWRAYVAIRGADLAELAQIWPVDRAAGLRGRGDVSLWLQSDRGRIDQVTVECGPRLEHGVQ